MTQDTTGRVVARANDLIAGLPTDSVDICITDPPWDLGGGRFAKCADYDRRTPEDIATTLSPLREAMPTGAHLYLFAPAGRLLYTIANAMTDHGWRLQRTLAWSKGSGAGLGAYRNAWEPVMILSNGPTRGYIGAPSRHPSLLDYQAPGGRTQKPWELYAIFLEMSSHPDGLALDPYCGTNPLAKAIRRMNRGQPWLASDILHPHDIADSVRQRPWRNGPPLGDADRGRYGISQPDDQIQAGLELDP